LPEFDALEELVQREDLNALAARFARVGCPHCGETRRSTWAVYNRAATIILRAERIDWRRPPRWAVGPADAETESDIAQSRPVRKRPRRLGGWMRRGVGARPRY
jgi:hypothetical protein